MIMDKFRGTSTGGAEWEVTEDGGILGGISSGQENMYSLVQENVQL